MDMYQKIEERKNRPVEENTNTISINWAMPTYRQTHSNPCEIKKV